MVLDPLVQLVHTLAKRIEDHRQALSQSEALTRYVLIDPLLHALGWDTEDPGQVQPEYSAGGGSADYALLEQGQPHVLVEAKKLGTLLSAALDQNINYCIRTGAPYLVNTDGQRWEIYDIYKQGPIDQKRVVTFDIATTDQNKVVAASLFLWRGNYRQVGVPAAPPSVPAPAASAPPSVTPVTVPATPPSTRSLGPAAQPLSLATFTPRPGAKAPASVVAPDGSSISCGNYADLFAGVVELLLRNGKLTAGQCPVKLPGFRKRSLIDTQPIHPDGTRFKAARQVGSLWVEVNDNSRQLTEHARFVLRWVKEDPALWKVEE